MRHISFWLIMYKCERLLIRARARAHTHNSIYRTSTILLSHRPEILVIVIEISNNGFSACTHNHRPICVVFVFLGITKRENSAINNPKHSFHTLKMQMQTYWGNNDLNDDAIEICKNIMLTRIFSEIFAFIVSFMIPPFIDINPSSVFQCFW